MQNKKEAEPDGAEGWDRKKKNGKCVMGGYTCSCDTEKKGQGAILKIYFDRLLKL